MSEATTGQHDHGDTAPGDHREASVAHRVIVYAVGLVLAAGLTGLSFAAAKTGLIWAPGIPVVLLVLAVAQMGVHLVFFLHLGTGPDHTNNILALAFGVLIVGLVMSGSLWIMANLNHMMPMHGMGARMNTGMSGGL